MLVSRQRTNVERMKLLVEKARPVLPEPLLGRDRVAPDPGPGLDDLGDRLGNLLVLAPAHVGEQLQAIVLQLLLDALQDFSHG